MKSKIAKALTPIVLVACLAVGAIVGATFLRHSTPDEPAKAAPTPSSGGTHAPNAPSHSQAQSVISSLTGTKDKLKAGPHSNVIATASTKSVPIFKSRGASHPYKTLHDLPASYGAPLVFLVDKQKDGWLHVYLPVRPNGSQAWVRAKQMTLSTTQYRIEIDLGAHRLILFKKDKKVASEPVGVGRSVTPTPPGRYYLVYLLRPTTPDSVFGKLAFGTSAYSNVFTSFAGGDGEVGLHGTNDPSTIGTNVSHGCLRLTNQVISHLARIVPLGTPLLIER